MNLQVPTMAEMMASGETPDVLFWVGCSGSFDDRAKKITKAIAINTQSRIFAIDLLPMESIPGVTFIQGNFLDKMIQNKLK